MKKINLFLIFVLCFFCINGFGQGTNCATADPFCTGTSYAFPMNTGTIAEGGPNYACLCTQPNPVWYYLLIDNPGNITIGISSPTGNDVDFTAWGPFSSPTAPCTAQLTAACTGCESGGTCYNNTDTLSSYPSGNTVDCSFDMAASEVFHILNALSGQYYLLCITNFSDSPGNLNFSQIAGPGTTNCNIVYCNMTELQLPVHV